MDDAVFLIFRHTLGVPSCFEESDSAERFREDQTIRASRNPNMQRRAAEK